MRNCLVMGSGRSGTSMMAGTLSKTDYYMGDDLIPGNNSNPKGFFESIEINSLNEAILASAIPARPKLLGKWFFRDRPEDGQRWLAAVPVETKLVCPPHLAQRIQNAVAHEPYCFKDPRLCYTLPAWRPYLKNVGFVTVFREPAKTARSIVKEVGDMPYLHSLAMSNKQALKVWTQMYRHILEKHRFEGDWLFMHYNQLLELEGQQKLSKFLDVPVDNSFPESRLSRSSSEMEIPAETMRLYNELCELSSYRAAA